MSHIRSALCTLPYDKNVPLTMIGPQCIAHTQRQKKTFFLYFHFTLQMLALRKTSRTKGMIPRTINRLQFKQDVQMGLLLISVGSKAIIFSVKLLWSWSMQLTLASKNLVKVNKNERNTTEKTYLNIRLVNALASCMA